MTAEDDDDDFVDVVREQRVGSDEAYAAVKSARVDVASGGIAGALLTYAVNTWVRDPEIRTRLIYGIPAIAVVVSVGLRFLSGLIHQLWRYVLAEIQRLFILRKVRKGLPVAEANMSYCFNDPASTAAQKKEARDHVNKIRKQILVFTVKGAMVIK